MEGYQVSAQCMALVRDDCLVPTKDAPELGYVRESTDKQYVPDVFYKVSQRWKPLNACLFCRFFPLL
jgi:nuclear protein localization family protein 4